MIKGLPGICAGLGLLLMAGVSSAQSASPFKVIVNASNAVSSLTKVRASRLFLKKTTKWDSGGKVQPVDQLKSSSLRQAFSEQIHDKDVRSVDSYWQTQLFAGRATPPPELASDAEVLSYVRSNAGAIGYVAEGAVLGDGVRVVEIEG